MKYLNIKVNSTTLISFKKKRPTVLLFDSGVGGLSVYQEIHKLLPNLHYLYVFDNIAFPYGEKSESFIISRVINIIKSVTNLYSITILVIACNSASTIILPFLRARFKFPVIGVVPAIKPAVELTRNGVVGLLATRGTVQRLYTKELILRFSHRCNTKIIGSGKLVQLAEDKLHGKIISIEEIKKILRPWLHMKRPPDTIVLGCTHFPLIIEELKKVLPQEIVFVDSGEAIARRTMWIINNQFPNTKFIDDNKKNIAYCMDLNKNILDLIPILHKHGFEKLKKLTPYEN